MDPKTAKTELRQAIKDRLSHIDDKARLAESRSICRRILESLPKEPTTLCAYFPLKDEADLRPLLQELPALGHHVFLPKVEGGKMVFRQFQNLEALTDGTYGIPEPSDDSPLLDPAIVSVALIPGRAFDAKGNRLGRGNGGYDIWIRRQRELNPKTVFWGIALECQLTQGIPVEAHDEKVDAIVTARSML